MASTRTRSCPKCGKTMDYCTPKEGEVKFTPFYICTCGHSEGETDWWESDDVGEIVDHTNKFHYLKTDVVNDALNGAIDMNDFIYNLERQYDKVEDELSALRRVVEEVRRRQR